MTSHYIYSHQMQHFATTGATPEIVHLTAGNPSKLERGIDMFGFSCGEMNDWNGISVDLTDKRECPFRLAMQQIHRSS